MGNENLICDFLGWELSNPKYPTDGLNSPTWNFNIHIFSKIDDVYNAVVELIKWYNEIKKN